MDRPHPLAPGTILQGRFEIEALLGQGSFGITYLASDRNRGDQVVVRELAPADAIRQENGILRLSRAGEAAAQRLRQTFLKEARLTSKLTGPSLLPGRASFVELGTAFLVREHLPGAMTLAERILRSGRLSFDEVERLLTELTSALDRLHANGILHLDIRPSNVLLAESGTAYLIDFGQSRHWRRELHRLEDWVEGLPPELALRGSRTGPATDVYELGAALYAGMTGMAPSSQNYVPVHQTRPDVPPWLDEAIAWALRPDPGERPASAPQLLAKKGPAPPPDPKATLEEFDRKAGLLKSMKFNRRQCPSCQGVLEEHRPLKLKVCPVCHEGTIRPRKVLARLCPNCRMGVLKHLPNLEPLSVCPACAEGLLGKRKRSLFSKEFVFACPECNYEFDWQPPQLFCVAGERHIGDSHICAEWREISKRSSEIWLCPCCSAQFDRIEDGRWRQAAPAKTGRYDALEPDEWARVAAGLPPEAGNAECDACGADYHVEGDCAALLEARFDPHGFAANGAGRFLSFEELRWVGVGKESPHPGLNCTECGTEFDFDPAGLKLIRTPSSGMLEYAGKPMSLENWHRAAADLPLAGQEAGFVEAFALALREAYTLGALPFSHRDSELVWRGPAARMEAEKGGWKKVGDGQLTIDQGGVRFGGMFKKAVVPWAEVTGVATDGVRLDFNLQDNDVVTYEVPDVEWSPPLDSGNRSIRLTVLDLAARIRVLMDRSGSNPDSNGEEPSR